MFYCEYVNIEEGLLCEEGGYDKDIPVYEEGLACAGSGLVPSTI